MESESWKGKKDGRNKKKDGESKEVLLFACHISQKEGEISPVYGLTYKREVEGEREREQRKEWER